jgi:Mn2+/Fe2+ NRAMP family transporter
VSGERKPAFPALLAWGAFLVVLTAVGLVFFRHGVEPPALLGGGAAFVLVLALGLAVTRRSVQSEGGGADPDGSPATVWLALSVALAALGAALGPWLIFIGGGMTVVGVAAVVRELRAQRQASRGLSDVAPEPGPAPGEVRQ